MASYLVYWTALNVPCGIPTRVLGPRRPAALAGGATTAVTTSTKAWTRILRNDKVIEDLWRDIELKSSAWTFSRQQPSKKAAVLGPAERSGRDGPERAVAVAQPLMRDEAPAVTTADGVDVEFAIAVVIAHVN